MASNKRKQDEKHLKTLREMVALPHNKQCFDCHQRGPTYINMTIGSYVCTACSGLLRGLNPPHRVKSISMASFTPEELDFIKSHGNEYCRQVWLGLYDNSMSSQTESREENKVKDFMAQKYERKRWYVAPSDSLLDKARKLNEGSISKQQTKPLKALLGENAPRLVVNNQEEETSAVQPEATGEVSFIGEDEPQPQVPQPQRSDSILEFEKPANAVPPPIQQPATSSPPQTQSPGNQSLQSSKSSGSTAMDLLGDLGGDPFSSPAQSGPPAGGGFADFGSFGGGGGGGHFPPAGSQPTPFAQMGSTPLQPGGGTGGVSSATSINGAFGSTSSQPGAGGDKYSNLGDLFSASPPKSETQPASTGWGTSATGAGGSVNWNSSAPASTGGINWGGESNSSTSTGGVNWNSSGSGGTTAASTVGTGWGVASTSSWNTVPTAQTNGISGSYVGKPGNPFLDASAVNPFGGGSNTSLTSQSTQGGAPNAMAPNPFGGAPQQHQGGFGQFGAPAGTPGSNPGFGQFGSATSTQGQSGFGQFGSVTSTQGQSGFGQFGMQNGGFGATQSSAGFGGAQTNTATGYGGQGFGGQQQAGGFPQQQPGFGAQTGFGGQPAGAGFGGQPAGFGGQPAGFGGQPQQMQGFGVPVAGGWGQPGAGSSVNPFMSTASQAGAPKSSSTNPFL